MPPEAAVLAALLTLFPPDDDQNEWQRYAVAAVAFHDALEAEYERGAWRHSRAQLEAAGYTAIIYESGLDRAVHEGTNHRNGHCPAQIHRGNPIWKKFAPTFDALLGTTYRATLWCFQTMFRTLVLGQNWCHEKGFRTRIWRSAMWRSYAAGRACMPTRHSYKRGTTMQRLEGRKYDVDQTMIALVRGVKRDPIVEKKESSDAAD